MKQLFHTPEGVRDIYNSECAKHLAIREKLHRILKQYGYSDIETPTFEFFDVFKKERGSVISQEMYKFFDREGNTLVLRPDITPPIARSAATYYKDEVCPLRLCYIANTFINNSSYQGRLKEATQAGVEMIGDGSVDADAEVIALIVESLKEAGLKEFQVSVGQVAFFKGLIEEAGFDEDLEENIRILMEEKNFFGAEQLILSQNIAPKLKEVFLELPNMMGGPELFERARGLTQNEQALNAIGRLEELFEILKYYGVSEYVTFDLGMLSKYKYYTGIIFRGYTYGMGEPVCTGGRYDKLMEQFGKEAAAVGFAISVDGLISALGRQKISIDTGSAITLILYDKQRRGEALKRTRTLRHGDSKVQLILKDSDISITQYRSYASRNNIAKVIFLRGDGTEESWIEV